MFVLFRFWSRSVPVNYHPLWGFHPRKNATKWLQAHNALQSLDSFVSAQIRMEKDAHVDLQAERLEEAYSVCDFRSVHKHIGELLKFFKKQKERSQNL